MNRKQPKIQILPPFEQISNNWELVTEIESSLNQFLSHPQNFSSTGKDDIERLGKSGIQQLVIIAKQFLQFVEILRSQQKHIEAVKASAAIAHEKLEQHEEVVRNYEKKFSERTKTMVEENRVLKETNDKMKRTFMETQEYLKSSLEQSKNQIASLRSELAKLQEDKKQLLEVITKLQQKLTNKEELIGRLQKVNNDDFVVKNVHQRVEQLLRFRIQKRKKPLATIKEPEFSNSPFIQQLALKDISALSKIITFLTPNQTLLLSSTGKRMRYLCGTKICIRSLCKIIIAVKNKRINYFKKHISYFEKLRQKVPIQILKNAYFRYHILKESVGHEIKQALNSSSLIFEGRFEGEQLYTGLPDFNKEIPPKLNFQEANILQVDISIIDRFKQSRGQERDQLIKEFEEMFHKIKNTYDIYRADEESSTLFIANTLKHFSKVFVLAKSLYFEAQQLQNLNAFLLSELNTWDRMEIDKNLQLQDLKAELQAQKKLKLFFTDKSIKSEQKALLEENMKLTYQMKYNRLNDLMNITCSEKDDLAKKHVVLTKANQKLMGQNRQLRKLYELTREKYNHVIEELVVVKQTIIKMNII